MNTKQEAQEPHIVPFIFTSTFYICSILACLKNETKVRKQNKKQLESKTRNPKAS
jgi:hypothetical protein